MTVSQRLDAVCEIAMGQAPSGDAYNREGKGWPLVAGAGDFGEKYPACKKYTTEAARLSKCGDIILGIRASIGEKVLADGEYCLGRGVAGLRGKSDLDSRYLWHWLTHIGPVLASKAKGATFKQVNKNDIGELEIILPSLPKQRRIAAILDHADALRVKRRESLAQLDSLTQSIFIEMFGDPVSNPKRWPIVSLGKLIHSASDGPHVSPEYEEVGIPFLSARHVRQGEISWHDLKYLSKSEAENQWRKCKPTRDDILYTKGGTTGFAAVVDNDIEFAIWVHIALLKPNKKLVNSKWLEAMLNSQYCYRQSQDLTHGAANRDLGLKRMVRILMYQPPLELQSEFDMRMKQLANQRLLQQRSLAEIEEFFASLQYNAFRREL